MSSSPTDGVLAAGKAHPFELNPEDTLRVCTPSAHQGGDLSFAGFDQALTRNINGREAYGKPYLVFHLAEGMLMYDGEGQPVLELTEIHSAGALDIMLPGCWHEMYEDGRPGCRDLISAALGIRRSELTGMASFFVSSTVTERYYDPLSRSTMAGGDHLVLRALRSVTVAVSACPDVELPGWRAGEVEVRLCRSN